MDEDKSFVFGDLGKYRAGLCFDKNAYHGCLIWSPGGVPVMQRMFVSPDWRGQGLGTHLVRYWAERFAFPRTKRFGVQSPNAKTVGILIKLGYVRRVGDLDHMARCFYQFSL
jgi:GNAT superfamily N-acetyltransferase